MRKLFQSPIRTFVTIALVWSVAGAGAFSCGFLAWLFARLTAYYRTLYQLSDRLSALFGAMSFPFGDRVDTAPGYFLLAVVFWAGVLTLILWVTRTIYRRLFYP